MPLPTILDAFTSGASGVSIYCRPCSRTVRLTIDKASITYGPNATFPEIAKRSRCSACGKRPEDARPHYPQHSSTLPPDLWDAFQRR
jgi:hypothetical protein